ncbi:MAG: glycoside hydrolase family 2 protein [Lachnospiraceae bacterium]|nr:glycoside hydrolase family 2 protein [Lachnospiraceae bacterium]
MIKESLNEAGWKMKAASGKIYDTTVPGSVMSVLLDAGVMEDPYYRENEKDTLALFEKDYEFFCNFSVSGAHMQEDMIELVFYGLDTLAEIYLNGRLLASTSDMHRTFRFSVKQQVRLGANELRVILHSPLAYLKNYKPEKGKEIDYTACGAIRGNQYLRKAHSMFGWDWGPQLPDAGIFRSVELHSYSKARIKDIRISQEHRREGVMVTIDPVLQMFDNIPVEIEVQMTGQKPVSVLTRMPEGNGAITSYGENKIQIMVEHPELWWPNGIGEHPLYTITIRIKKADYLYDEKTMRIGLRTLTVSQKEDEFGEEFAFCVNGVKIFAMGADYIPEDCIYSRITKERLTMLVDSAARANYNCLRVWGGGYYPSDDFYDLCDEYGIIVWQDLMYACNVYELTPELEENIVAEARDNVERLRHHACLGLWCGNNEIESGWSHWPDFQKEKPALRADYIKIFEYLLPKTVKEADGETFYWPSSPSSGGCFDAPDDENRGDAHYWDVWHGQKPFEDYKEHYFRFLSEFGFQSIPSMKTIRTFTEPEDRNIFSPVMESHQKNGWANGKILYYLSENFLYPKDFESLLYVSQILQGMAIKFGVEHFRQNRGRCMGTLYWQMNDNWPVVSWSSIDYFGRWKALHYMARRFYAPIAGSIRKEGNKLTAYVDNGSLTDVNCKLELLLWDMDGKELSRHTESKRSYHGKVAVFETCDATRMIEKYGERNIYAEAVFIYGDGIIQVEAETFVPYKHLSLKPARISREIVEEEELFRIILTTDAFAPYVFLDLKDADGIFSDNAFHMTPGFNYEVVLEKKDIFRGEIVDAAALANQLTVTCLQDSYMDLEESKAVLSVVNGEVSPETALETVESEVAVSAVDGGNDLTNKETGTEQVEKPAEAIQTIEQPEMPVYITEELTGKVVQETEKPESVREDTQGTKEPELTEENTRGIEEPDEIVQTEPIEEEFDEEKAIQEVLGQIKKTVQERNMGTLSEQSAETSMSETLPEQSAEGSGQMQLQDQSVETSDSEQTQSDDDEEKLTEATGHQVSSGGRKKDRKKNRKGRR